MQLTIIKNIGKRQYPFTVEGKNLFALVQESQKLSFQDVDKCGLCGSDNLYLASHVAQETYHYVHITCAACRAQLVFGQQKKEPDVFFLRRNEDKSYAWQEFNKDNWNQDQKNTGDAAPQQPAAKPPAQTGQQPSISDSYKKLVYMANKVADIDSFMKCEIEIKSCLDTGMINQDEFHRVNLILGNVATTKKIM